MIHIDASDGFHADYNGITVVCPHCVVHSHLTAVGCPSFAQLLRQTPKNIGVVFRCDSCGEPVFLKFPARSYGAQRIELAGSFVEIERAREDFALTYLPHDAEPLFREALTCYGNGCFRAFAAMCRLTSQAVFRELGDSGKLKLFDSLQDVRALAELDDETFAVIRNVIFGAETTAWPQQPELDATRASVLLEVMKDLLYQAFVRKSKLMQAMTLRRYLAAAPTKMASDLNDL
jgi:hypothetical protein